MVIEDIISNSRHKVQLYSKKENTIPIVYIVKLLYANNARAKKSFQFLIPADIFTRVYFNVLLKRSTNPLA